MPVVLKWLPPHPSPSGWGSMAGPLCPPCPRARPQGHGQDVAQRGTAARTARPPTAAGAGFPQRGRSVAALSANRRSNHSCPAQTFQPPALSQGRSARRMLLVAGRPTAPVSVPVAAPSAAFPHQRFNRQRMRSEVSLLLAGRATSPPAAHRSGCFCLSDPTAATSFLPRPEGPGLLPFTRGGSTRQPGAGVSRTTADQARPWRRRPDPITASAVLSQ
jgi:hypothetical protein